MCFQTVVLVLWCLMASAFAEPDRQKLFIDNSMNLNQAVDFANSHPETKFSIAISPNFTEFRVSFNPIVITSPDLIIDGDSPNDVRFSSYGTSPQIIVDAKSSVTFANLNFLLASDKDPQCITLKSGELIFSNTELNCHSDASIVSDAPVKITASNSNLRHIGGYFASLTHPEAEFSAVDSIIGGVSTNGKRATIKNCKLTHEKAPSKFIGAEVVLDTVVSEYFSDISSLFYFSESNVTMIGVSFPGGVVLADRSSMTLKDAHVVFANSCSGVMGKPGPVKLINGSTFASSNNNEILMTTKGNCAAFQLDGHCSAKISQVTFNTETAAMVDSNSVFSASSVRIMPWSAKCSSKGSGQCTVEY